MTVNELVQKHSFKQLALPCGERDIKGIYIGDLLSWVMGKAKADDAWITIMSNINVVAVATLTDVACIILAENVIVDENIINTAISKNVNIISTEKTAYEIALILNKEI